MTDFTLEVSKKSWNLKISSLIFFSEIPTLENSTVSKSRSDLPDFSPYMGALVDKIIILKCWNISKYILSYPKHSLSLFEIEKTEYYQMLNID